MKDIALSTSFDRQAYIVAFHYALMDSNKLFYKEIKGDSSCRWEKNAYICNRNSA